MESMYSSALTQNSSTYSLKHCGLSNHFYEAIQLNVVETNYYSLRSNSSIDTHGSIYKNKFNPVDPSENFLLQNDDSCGGVQFELIVDLQAGTTYVLVVSTSLPNVTGAFSMVVSGPNNVSLKHISEYLYYFSNNQHANIEYRKYL
jgi:hypothetical protein